MPRPSTSRHGAPAITEAAFQSQIVDLARTLGYDLAYHPYYSDRSLPGWPDLVLVSTRRRRTVYAELKAETGTFEPEQPGVLTVLAAAGNEVYVWRPSDLDAARTILAASSRPTRAPATAWDPENPPVVRIRGRRPRARTATLRPGPRPHRT